MSSPLPIDYFQNPDTLFLARDLIGKYLISSIDGCLTGGMIIETEAYLGAEDRACHAFGYRRTQRNEAMYAKGGIAYVYLCYGIHALFNIVTNKDNIPHAILIRAISPEIGLETIQKRRKNVKPVRLASGPGTLTQALGIRTTHNGIPLDGPLIWVEERGSQNLIILKTPRIGIDYAGPDALKPYRFIAQRQ